MSKQILIGVLGALVFVGATIAASVFLIDSPSDVDSNMGSIHTNQDVDKGDQEGILATTTEAEGSEHTHAEELVISPFNPDLSVTSFVIAVDHKETNSIHYYAFNARENSTELIHVLDFDVGGYKLFQPFKDGTWLATYIPAASSLNFHRGNDLYRIDLDMPDRGVFLVGSTRAMIRDAMVTTKDNVYFLDSNYGAIDSDSGELHKYDTATGELEIVTEIESGLFGGYELVGENGRDWLAGVVVAGGDGAGSWQKVIVADTYNDTIKTLGSYSRLGYAGSELLSVSPNLLTVVSLYTASSSDDPFDTPESQSLISVSHHEDSPVTTTYWSNGFGPDLPDATIIDATVQSGTYTALVSVPDGNIHVVQHDITTKFGDHVLVKEWNCPVRCYLVDEGVYRGMTIVASVVDDGSYGNVEFYYVWGQEFRKINIPVIVPETGFGNSGHSFIPVLSHPQN